MQKYSMECYISSHRGVYSRFKKNIENPDGCSRGDMLPLKCIHRKNQRNVKHLNVGRGNI